MTRPQSHVLITLDSCRWDTFDSADLPFLKSHPYAQAWSHATFTGPAHFAYFSGKLPHNYSGEAIFDTCAVIGREGQVQPKPWRVLSASRRPDTRMWLPGANAPDGFANLGYATIGTAGVGWFDPKEACTAPLLKGFQRFKFFDGGKRPNTEGIEPQVDWVLDELSRVPPEQPYFLFINAAETHYPYHAKGYEGRARWGKPEECRRFQRQAVEYVDGHLARLFATLSNYLAIITADHGDCWGEDGLWAHGIYHPKVLEIPMVVITDGDLVDDDRAVTRDKLAALGYI